MWFKYLLQVTVIDLISLNKASYLQKLIFKDSHMTRLCIWRIEDFYRLSFSFTLAFCLFYDSCRLHFNSSSLSKHLIKKISFSVCNVLCHGPWLCCEPEAPRGAGDPSLAHVPAMLKFQVCSEVLYLRGVKCCVGHCTADLWIQCSNIQRPKAIQVFFFPFLFLEA